MKYLSATDKTVWKSRNELPGLIKLDIKYDIVMLRKDIHEYASRDLKDSMEDGPYKNLRDAYGYNLTPAAYNGKTNQEVDKDFDWNKIPYKQIALTNYDPNYEVRKDRNSGKRYDRGFMKGDKRFDERAYSKLKNDLPEYLREVIKSFGPTVTRVCVAITEPGGGIAPHRDYDTTFSTRYHIAIDTNTKATMNDIHVPADGYVWFINAGKKHWVKNEGNKPRTHLMIIMDSQEVLDNEWLEVYNSEKQ